MEAKVDMSLDDIIAANRKSDRGRGGARGRGRGRGTMRGQSGPPRRNNFNSRDSYNGRSDSYNSRGYGGDARRSLPSVPSGPGKLLITNLDYGVSEGDLYELFSEFGNIKMAVIHYDRGGLSLGSAEVAFDRKSDAIKGLKQYNGVPLDGKPMRIEITGSERDLLQSRPAPAASSYPPRRGGGVGQRRGGGYSNGYNDRRGGRGSFRGGRGGPVKKPDPPKKETLDEEMDAYMKNKST